MTSTQDAPSVAAADDYASENEGFRRASQRFTNFFRGAYQTCSHQLSRMEADDPGFLELVIRRGDAESLSESEWEVLGRRVAKSRRLEGIGLGGLRLGDSDASSLFRTLDGCVPAKRLNLMGNRFGAKGIRAMVPFLRNSPSLIELKMGDNKNIDTECFELMVAALHGGRIENLRLRGCGIDSITALGDHTLGQLRLLDLDRNSIRNLPPSLEKYTNLEHLWLEGNMIGRGGHRSISLLLRQESSSLKNLDLTYTGMRDEEAEMIAGSLRRNASLHRLRLEGNKFGERGHRAFLGILNDVSSVERTFCSNHALWSLELPRSIDPAVMEILYRIGQAAGINKRNARRPCAAGRAKVVAAQLNGGERTELCRIQGVDPSRGGVFSEVDPVLLPEVLALAADNHGQNELYCMLIATVPELLSIVNRKDVLRQNMSKNRAQIAALTAVFLRQTAALNDEISRMNQELISLESLEHDRWATERGGDM